MNSRKATTVTVLSAGAAESLVERTRGAADRAGIRVEASFAPVGVLAERLRDGEACDLYVTSEERMVELTSSGVLEVDQVADLGWVKTALAVRRGDPVPDVGSAEAVFAALREAVAVFTPDPVRSTAGAHFQEVLDRAGVLPLPEGVLHAHPNGKRATGAMAVHPGPGPVVTCTQATEIHQVEGAVLAGPLPPPLDLATRYQCALVAARGTAQGSARLFDLLTGPDTAALRAELGFDEERASA